MTTIRGLPGGTGPLITSNSNRYIKVNVLMLSWKDIDDDTERDEFQAQLCQLSEEFKAYRFVVETYEIESDMPYRKLSERLLEFLHRHDEKGTLLILYYGGHGLNRDCHCLWLRDNPQDSEELTDRFVDWSSLQNVFLDECASHVLFLLDCCYAGSSAQITDSTSKVEIIAAAGFEQVAPLRGTDSFTTFLTRILKEVRRKGKTITASALARKISARLNSTEFSDRSTRVTPRHFPLHDGEGHIKIRPLVEQQYQKNEATPKKLEPPPMGRSHAIRAFGSRYVRRSSKWGFALMDDHRPQTGEPPPAELRELRTPSTTPCDFQVSASPRALFKNYHVQRRQIRVLRIKPLTFEGPLDDANIILCTVETINLPEKPAEVSAPDYKALSWYCTQEAPWNAHIGIIPDNQLIPVPAELKKAFQDIRHKSEEISVWVYQVCIDRWSPEEVEQQTTLVPDIFRNASEVIIWPGARDNSSDIALAFVPEVIDLRNIDDLVLGHPSPVTTPTTRLGTPPASRHRQDTPEPPKKKRKTGNGRTLPTLRCNTGNDVPEKWKSLVGFMTRPYFGRRWAFLEVALARSANIYCGRRKLSWPGFCDAVTILGSRFEEVRLLLERPEVMGSIQNQYVADLRALGAYSFAEASRELFPRQSDGSILGLCRLEKMVSALPVLRSWHPNAVIYTLLPLASDADEWENTKLPPIQAYQHFVHHCACISRSIDIICRPWAPTQEEIDEHTAPGVDYGDDIYDHYDIHDVYDSGDNDGSAASAAETASARSEDSEVIATSEDTDGSEDSTVHGSPTRLSRTSRRRSVSENKYTGDNRLPSWVCQIDKHPFGNSGKKWEVPERRNGEVFVGAPDKPIYNASKSFWARPVFGYHNDSGLLLYDGTMTAAGFQIGPITRLYPRAIDGIILTDWIRAFGRHDGQGIVPDHLWRTLVADRGPNGTPAPTWYHRACRYWLDYSGDDDISYQKLKGGKHSSMAVEYLVRVRSVIWNRRLFTVPGWDGRVLYGLAPKETDEKDVVCVLNGCSVPVVMRDQGRHWTLVGECFVYGIMDGEAVDVFIGGKRVKVQEFLMR